MFQGRCDGDCQDFTTFAEALAFAQNSDIETGKVSWDLEGGRLILWLDGNWEYRTEESLIKLVDEVTTEMKDE